MSCLVEVQMSAPRESEPPALLFKYLSPGNYLPKLLRGESIKFRDPLTFNDPFECCYKVVYNGTDDQIFAHFYKVAVNAEPLKPGRWRDMAAAAVENAKRGIFTAEGEGIRRMMSRFGVLCLTEKPDNLLMWSHYADEHRGLCVGFHPHGSPFELLYPVTYVDEIPEIDFLSQDEDRHTKHFHAAICHKASCWSYEREWRAINGVLDEGMRARAMRRIGDHAYRQLIERQMGPGLIPFDNRCIRMVIFGHRAAPEFVAETMAVIKGLGHKIDTYRAVAVPDRYAVMFTRI